MKPFAERLLTWWQVHGRRELPWQHPRTPYRVWVSEIMLQQTRVETVIDYFNRFMQRFPDLKALAETSIDDVLSLWSGLGYYARARNLHAAARIMLGEHSGKVPDDFNALHALPGIGRSTAAAILAQGFHQRATILDGNVKRVLARHAGIAGWPGKTAVANRLWHEAELRTPVDQAADYTQAIMDLGATLCHRGKPLCEQCPVSADCVARSQQCQHELPTPKPRKTLPERVQNFDILRNRHGELLLIRRPPSGIWGGLWCLPEHDAVAVLSSKTLLTPAPIEHSFSHFKLSMRFRHLEIEQSNSIADDNSRWLTIEDWLKTGLPRPIRALLESLIAAESAGHDVQ
ncbi:MAG: A/G-specific adenine glycosylase [Pseudomonadota bacterium]